MRRCIRLPTNMKWLLSTKRIGAADTLNRESERVGYTARADKIKKDMDKIMVTVSQEEAGFSEFVREFVLWVDFDDVQKKIYDEMDKHSVISKYGIIATNAADRVGKLSQIASGTLKIDDGRALISCNKAWKIKKHKCDKKIAVFYKYRAEREVLEE